MGGVETFVGGSEKLTAIFGGWPSFHDSEIVELHLWRGVTAPPETVHRPTLALKIHLSDTTGETDAAGYYVLRHHTLTTLHFEGVDEFEMNGFNRQNVVFGLSIERGTSNPDSVYTVTISSSYGSEMRFKCLSVKVVDAVPCSPTGVIPS